MKYLILLGLLVLVGCTTTPTECLTVNCQVCNEPIQEEPVESKPAIYKIDSGTEVYLIPSDDLRLDIVNCGKIAYSPITIESIDKILLEKNLKIKNLIVPNNGIEYVGGCKDILIEYPGIELVHIYGPYVDTEEYNDLLRWTPSSKLILHPDDTYELPDGDIIDY